MKIKFKKSAPGFAYFAGEIGDINPEAAAKLVDEGFAIIVPETEGEKNELPADLPCREILFNAGLETVEDIKNVIDTLTEIKGITKKTAEKIAAYVNVISE